MVAHGHGKTVRRIALLRNVFQLQDVLQHGCHLVFSGVAIARDGFLDLLGRVFKDGDVVLHGRGDSHTLRPAEFEHRLGILVVERRLYREFLDAVPGDQRIDIVKDPRQAVEVVVELLAVDMAYFQQFRMLPVRPDNAIPRYIAAGVYSEDDLFCFHCLNSLIFTRHMLSEQHRNYAVIALKVFIFFALTFLLYKQVVQHREFEEVLSVFREGMTGRKTMIILALLVTMAFNWSLETVKWRSLVGKILPISFYTALKGVLFGIAFSLFTPNRVGEFGGRVVALPAKRGPAVVVTLLGSLSQIVMNLVLGGLGMVIYFFIYEYAGYVHTTMIFLWILLTAGLHLLYFNLDLVEGALLKIPLLKRVKEHIDVILRYDRRQLISYLLLSGARCLTYYFQFWLSLKFFGIHLPVVSAMVLIAAMYFVQTIVPTFAIIEVVFRGNVAITFLSVMSENTAGIFSATFLIWAINLILPAAIGLLLFTGHRLYARKT